MKFLFIIILLISFSSFSQTTNSNNTSTDIITGYTFDYEMVRGLLLDQKLNRNTKECAGFKSLVDYEDFPVLNLVTVDHSQNYDLLRQWIEKHPNEIISALKKAKRFDVLTEY